MKTRTFFWRLVIAAAVTTTGALGCAPPVEPQIASSSPEPNYAAQYPDALSQTMTEINEAEAKTKENTGKFSSFPDELKSPPWDRVLVVVDLADQSGRAYAYVEARRETDGARAFFEAEQEEIIKKVSGAAYFAAKQKGCEADVSGAAAHALKETVKKRLEERLRERSEANIYIERNQTALGKDNVPKLHEQADAIAAAAYSANVVIVESKLRLKRMMEEGETVKKTLDDAIRAEQAYQNESDRTDAEKKASEERAEKMRNAAAKIDSALKQAQGVSERVEERVQAAQKAYNDAIMKLREDVKKRAGK